MLDQDLAGIPEVMTILEEKQLVADRLDPRVRYFPTSNVDLCDNVDDRLSISSSIIITSKIDLYENINDRGNFCAGLMVHKRETIATEIVLISLDSFKDIIPGINNCVRIESQVKEIGILSKCT